MEPVIGTEICDWYGIWIGAGTIGIGVEMDRWLTCYLGWYIYIAFIVTSCFNKYIIYIL